MKYYKTCLLMLAMLSTLGASAWANSTNRADVFQRQLKVLDQRTASQYSDTDHFGGFGDPLDLGVSAYVPRKGQYKGRYTGSYRGDFLPMARAAARKNRIPEELFLRLIQQESGWKPRIRSHKGAIGLTQLMPQTAKNLGVDPYNVKQNLEGGARYLRRQYDRFGSWPLALAAYNAGPGAVSKYKGIPPYKETRNYVRVIWGRS